MKALYQKLQNASRTFAFRLLARPHRDRERRYVSEFSWHDGKGIYKITKARGGAAL